MSRAISIRIDDRDYRKLVESGVNQAEKLKEYVRKMTHDLNALQQREKLDAIIRERVKPSEPYFASKGIMDDRDSVH
ncbi:MAG: hypothetical protein ACP5NK_07355 [Thermoplasmata archaeon]